MPRMSQMLWRVLHVGHTHSGLGLLSHNQINIASSHQNLPRFWQHTSATAKGVLPSPTGLAGSVRGRHQGRPGPGPRLRQLHRVRALLQGFPGAAVLPGRALDVAERAEGGPHTLLMDVLNAGTQNHRR